MRLATPKDLPGVMTLIQELADYEKMPHGPKIDSTSKYIFVDFSHLFIFFIRKQFKSKQK